MTGEEPTSRNMGAITGAIVLIAIVVGLLYYYMTSDWLPSIGIPILIIGAYELVSSFFRSTTNDQFGTNESGAAALWGFVFIAIGGAMLIYRFADGGIIMPVVFAILVIIAYIIYAMFRKKQQA